MKASQLSAPSELFSSTVKQHESHKVLQAKSASLHAWYSDLPLFWHHVQVSSFLSPDNKQLDKPSCKLIQIDFVAKIVVLTAKDLCVFQVCHHVH